MSRSLEAELVELESLEQARSDYVGSLLDQIRELKADKQRLIEENDFYKFELQKVQNIVIRQDEPGPDVPNDKVPLKGIKLPSQRRRELEHLSRLEALRIAKQASD